MSRQRWAFVLTLWVEDDPYTANKQPLLRGSLQQAGAERVHYFTSLAEVVDLLAQASGWIGPGGASYDDKEILS